MGKMRSKQVWENRHLKKHYHYLESDSFSPIYKHASYELMSSSASSILDVGCWSGMLCSALYASGYMGEYLGLDISDSVIKECKKKFTHNDSCTFVSHDFSKGYVDGDFDSLYLGGVLYYVSDREKFIQGFIDRYNLKCVVIQDLVKTPVDIDQFERRFDIIENQFEVPTVVNDDPSLSRRKVFTLNLK